LDCREPDESAVTDSAAVGPAEPETAAVVTAALVEAGEWALAAALVVEAAGVAVAAPVATAAARGLSVRQGDLGDSAVESGHLANWG
jgi:hypothetical protein